MAASQVIGLVALRGSIGEIVNRVHFARERITINKNRKPVAALIPIEDLQLLEEIEDALDARQIDAMMENLDPADLETWKKAQE